ncbi:MAG: 5-(carboxyamino)imidazole ribonucleotide synthase [Planctomycetota bacterium]
MHQPILPGSTLGMVGSGQLGRMFAMAAARMGYHVIVFASDTNDPAAQVAHDCVIGDLGDAEKLDSFAARCDAITLEFENIPAAAIERCSRHAPTFPSASVLATAQDRLVEKSTFRDAGLPVTPFAPVSDAESLRQAGQTLGWPLIVKTARSGYDGKGQFRVPSSSQADDVQWNTADAWIAEQFVPFEREVSVIVARTADGRDATFPLFENTHTNHILDTTLTPLQIDPSLEQRIHQIATQAAEVIQLVGLMCVELFVCGDEVMINEVAPRPHNSGHVTIEACQTCQYEQQVRAVCGLPLGSTELVAPVAGMANLLGDLWKDGNDPAWNAMLDVPGVSLHLYGKSQPIPGRKMGHLATTGSTRDEVVSRLKEARKRLTVGR